MVERLVEALAGLEPALSAEELADALWLARFLDPPGSASGAGAHGADVPAAEVPGPEARADTTGGDRGNSRIQGAASTSGPGLGHGAGGTTSSGGETTAGAAGNGAAQPGSSSGAGDRGGPPGTDAFGNTAATGAEPQAGLFLPDALSGGRDATAFPVRAPTVPALPRTLELGRALRALRSEVPAPLPGRLDEERTATRFADTGIWDPQPEPAFERRFDLVLVVDTAASMKVWRHTADELRLLLERLGAFRDLRVRHLDTDGDVAVESPGGTEGRQIVLVVSDCIGAAWRDGRAAALLERWGRSCAVAIVQPLPQRLWRRCAAATEQVFLRAPAPGAANARLAARPRDRARGGPVPPGVPVPVLALERRWLGPWAAMVAGSGREIAAEALFTGRPVAGHPPPASAEPTALERVLRFRASASPTAYELAGYLAAAPLRLPVMRLVQRAMLPGSTPAHLAEVFLGGLLREADDPAGGRRPDRAGGAAYEFHDGVRDVLLSGLRREEALAVLREVWGTVRDRLGSTLDFPALLAAVREDTGTLPSDQPFAQVAARVLARLGGSYGKAAEHLASAVAVAQRERRPNGSSGRDEPDAGRWQGGEAAAGPRIFGGVPPRDRRFRRRDVLMARVRQALRGTGAAVLLPEEGRPIGGTGKTRLAIELVHELRAAYDVVWWMPAAEPWTVRTSLGDLARRLGTPLSDDLGVTIANLLGALRGGLPGGRWLLVYDGACAPDGLADLVPRPQEGGTAGDVLITSDDRDWAQRARGIDVGVLSRPSSIALLRDRVPGLAAEEAARVAEYCEDIPGVLVQAAAWLVPSDAVPPGAVPPGAGQDGTNEHLRLFDQRARALGDPYAAALEVTLDRLRTRLPGAADLLTLWSGLGPAPVTADMLAAVLPDEGMLRTAMAALEQAGIATLDPATGGLFVSPAAQAVVRRRSSADERAWIRSRAQATLAAATPVQEPEDQATWPLRARITPHVVPSGAAGPEADVRARALVLDQVRFLLASGDHETCRELAYEALAGWPVRQADTDDVEWVLDVFVALTRALRALVRPEEAAVAGEKVVGRLRARLGPHAPAVTLAADLLGMTGSALRAYGDLVAAHGLDRDHWQKTERRYGPEHPEALRAAGEVATGLRLLGRFDEARELDAVTLRRLRARGRHDGAALEASSRLGRDLHGLGRYDEALRVQEAALDHAPERLGRDHAAVLQAQAAHAGTLRKKGRTAAAVRLADAALEGHLRRFGPDHPSTLATRMTAALARAAAGSPGPGRVLAEEALAGYRRSLGEEHPLTAACAIDLAILLRVVGDVRAAFEADQAAVAVLDGAVGPEHYFTLCGAAGMAHDLYLLGESNAAREMAASALEGFRRRHGPSHPYTLACAHDLEVVGRGAGGAATGPVSRGGAVEELASLLGGLHPEVRAAARGELLDCDIELPPL